MKTLFPLLLLATSVAFAQDKPKTPPAPAPAVAPVLTEKQQKEFFKAQAESLAASAKAEQAGQTATTKQSALIAAVKTVSDACGKEFTPSLDGHGELVCVAMPKPAPEVKK